MIDFDRLAITPAFLTFGETATYTPPTGPPVSCRVIREGGGKPLTFGPITVYLASLSFDVRQSEVSAPVPGGVFQVGATRYTVTGSPHHPEDDAHGYVWSCPVLWGAPIIYRTTTGNQVTLNPPTGSGWTIAANAAAGATSINIKATLTTGQLRAGDKAIIGATTHTITNTVSAASNVFTGVALSPPLVAPVVTGAAVSLAFACDRPVLAGVAGYDASQLLGGIAVGDRRVIIMQSALVAAGIPTPTATDSALIEGRWFRVKTTTATYSGADPFVWDLECAG